MPTTEYGMAALAGELEKLKRAEEGSRNQTLNDVWFALCQLAAAGHLDHDKIRDPVVNAARGTGLPDSEIHRTMASAEKGARTKPRSNVPDPDTPRSYQPQTPGGHGGYTQPGHVDAQPSTPPLVVPLALPDAFWKAREALGVVRRAAWSRGRSAEAVLGATLARVAANSPHWYKLPATVASRCGLSLIVALTGPPGTGKSSSKNIAVELAPRQHIEPECDDVPPGSGEGMIEVMFEYTWEENEEGKGKWVKKQARHNVFMFADEGEVLAVQARRSSANTILPVLRTVFTDGTLGQANASEDRRRRVPGGSYVYGIVLGIQPDKTQALFDDLGGGTPQRFLWMPTDAPVPPPGHRPEWPGELPHKEMDHHGWSHNWDYQLDPAIAAEIANNDHRRQAEGCDPLDQHADLIRLKVAAILATLEGRRDVTIDDWQLAEAVMIVSASTRGRVMAALQTQRAEANRQRGEAEGERQIVAGRKVDDVIEDRIRRGVLRKLDNANGEWVAHNEVRRSLKYKLRDDAEGVIEKLVADGVIEAKEVEQGIHYRRSNKVGGAS